MAFDFAYWVISCPAEECPGFWDTWEPRHGIACDGCDLRDAHPIPMSELYDLEKLHGLYSSETSSET